VAWAKSQHAIRGAGDGGSDSAGENVATRDRFGGYGFGSLGHVCFLHGWGQASPGVPKHRGGAAGFYAFLRHNNKALRSDQCHRVRSLMARALLISSRATFNCEA